MDTEILLAQIFAKLIEDDTIKSVYYKYSGRGYGGRSVTGLVLDRFTSISTVVAEVALNVMRMNRESTVVHLDQQIEIMENFIGMRSDSLGYDQIIYFDRLDLEVPIEFSVGDTYEIDWDGPSDIKVVSIDGTILTIQRCDDSEDTLEISAAELARDINDHS